MIVIKTSAVDIEEQKTVLIVNYEFVSIEVINFFLVDEFQTLVDNTKHIDNG